jgi:hypothetical protein
MSTTARVGSAVAAGYLLGRFKKLRLALIVGSALANKDVRASGMGLLQRGGGSLGTGGLTQQVKTELMHAGRAAAVSVAASKINRLSDRLQERSEAMRSESGRGGSRTGDDEEVDDQRIEQEPEDEDVDEPTDEEEDLETDELDEDDETGTGEEPEDEYEEDEYEDEPEADTDEEPDEHRRRSPRRRRTAAPVGGGA